MSDLKTDTLSYATPVAKKRKWFWIVLTLLSIASMGTAAVGCYEWLEEVNPIVGRERPDPRGE